MSVKHLHLDFETFCGSVDIRDVGAYRYANAEDFEVLCCAFSFEDSEPVIWHPGLDEIDMMQLEPYFEALRDPSVLIMAHNCMFEYSVLQAHSMKIWGIPCPDVSRLCCTMSLARRAALPGKLETLAEVLELPHKKDSRGKSLIRKFCVLQAAKKPTKKNPNGLPPHRILPSDEPEAFQELLDYCVQDVRVEKLVFKKLSYFADELNDRNYVLDQKINARGVPVNLNALRHAQKLIEEETEIVSHQFRELTGFEVTQNAVLLKWLKERGYSGDDLQAETIEYLLEKNSTPAAPPRRVDYAGEHGGTYTAEVIDQRMTEEAVTALKLKQSIAYASIKKVKTMLQCAGPHDNRIRGTLNHHGATTGRWTASLTQMQNMKRPTIKQSEAAYREICNGISRDMMEICYGPVLEVISSCVRHFVQDVREEI